LDALGQGTPTWDEDNTVKAAIYNREKGIPEVVEVPIPEIGDNEILLKPMAVGVCGSEVVISNLAGPGSLGHEPAGIVAKAGSKVKNVKEGDRVFVHHRVACLVCRYCRRGYYTMCSKYKEYGFDPSAYAEYTRVLARNVELDTIKLPKHVSFDEGCLIEPLATVWRAVKRTNIQIGDSVLIIGAGFAGLAAVQIVRIFGAGLVGICDLIDSKLDLAKKLGADLAINPKNQDVLEIFRAANEGRKADIVLVIAGSIAALEQGIQLTEKGGTVTQYGVSEKDETISLVPFDLLHTEVTYSPSYSSSPIDTKEVAGFLFLGKIKGLPLISHHFGLNQIIEALELKKKATDSIKILIHPHDQ
jgi:L-iditol 2-dehydrogenase